MTKPPCGAPSRWDVGPQPRRGPLARAASAVLRVGPLRWLVAELIPLGCLAIGAAITWIWPTYGLVGEMIGLFVAPVLGFLFLYMTLGASQWWVLPLALCTMAVSVFGSVAIPDMLLAHRGRPTEAVIDIVTKHPGGGWDCTFKRPDGTPIPGTQHIGCSPDVENSGDRVTLLVDPRGQIPPAPASQANPLANPVFGITSTALLVLVVAGAVANGEHWIRRHPPTWTLYERLIVKRGIGAQLWLRRSSRPGSTARPEPNSPAPTGSHSTGQRSSIMRRRLRHPIRGARVKAVDRSPSTRLFLMATGLASIGLAMFAASVATDATGGPKVLSGAFMVLMVLCPLAGYIIARRAAKKSREENEQLEAQAMERIRREKGG